MPFIAEASPLRSMLLAAGAALFVLGCLWGLGFLGPVERPMSPLLGWSGIVFFSLCFLVAVPRILRTGPAVRIDSTGLWWRDWSDRTIPWTEVEAVWPAEIKRQKLLCLRLRHPEEYPPRGFFALTAKANRNMGFGDVAVALSGTDGTFDDMVDAVRRFRPDLLRD